MPNPEQETAASPRHASKIYAWGPPCLWAALLYVLSAIPGHRFPSVRFSLSDKILHGLVYGVLGALCFRAVRMTTRMGMGRAVIVAALICLGYGLSDEIHQMFVPNRSPEVLDAVADLIGGTTGAFLASRLSWMRGRG